MTKIRLISVPLVDYVIIRLNIQHASGYKNWLQILGWRRRSQAGPVCASYVGLWAKRCHCFTGQRQQEKAAPGGAMGNRIFNMNKIIEIKFRFLTVKLQRMHPH